MNDVKFRAWDKIQNVMFNFDIYNVPPYVGQTYLVGEKFERIYELMQYTGLKDKNGIEIYEGDIVNNSGLWVLHSTDQLQYDKRIYGEGMIFVVNVNITGVELRTKKDWNRNTRKDFSPNGCHGDPYVDNHTAWNLQKTLEVIGNIYKNPELLEGEVK